MNKEILGKLENIHIGENDLHEYNTKCLYSLIYDYFIECYVYEKKMGLQSEYLALHAMIGNIDTNNNNYAKVTCNNFSKVVNVQLLCSELYKDGFSIDYINNSKDMFEIGITEENFERLIAKAQEEKEITRR